MKRQKNHFQKTAITTLFFVWAFSTMYSIELPAQVSIADGINSWGYSAGAASAWFKGEKTLAIQDDGKLYQVPYIGNFVDLTIPDNPTHNALYVSVRGGDGGSRSNHKLISPHIVKGGSGATISGYYKIGTGDKQVAPGDVLRFIVGRKGDNTESVETRGASGAAGTGLFLKKNGTNTWITLMVGGGGGGAYSDCCTVSSEGRSASLSPDGKEGGGVGHTGGNGGTNGGDGNDTSGGHGGGGINGVFKNGEPVGSAYTDANGHTYQFGCGFGGSNTNAKGNGSGGGGYSGGGAGSTSASGGGGGSYVNSEMEDIVTTMRVNSNTSNPQDGYVQFQFTDYPLKTIHLTDYPNKCIDNSNDKTDNSNNIQILKCNGGSSQDWVLAGPTIKYAQDLSKCLDLDHSNTLNGANIQLYDCNGTSAQNWIYDGRTTNIRSGIDVEKCLDIAAHYSPPDHSNIRLWDCDDIPTQHWAIDGATTVKATQKYAQLRSTLDTAKCIDVNNSATTNGANIQIFSCNDTDAQLWYFQGVTIRLNKDRNKCLDLDHSKTANGTNIQLWDCNDTDAQKWVYDGLSGSFRSAVDPNKCIDLRNSNTTNKNNIQLWDCNGTNAQKFEIY